MSFLTNFVSKIWSSTGDLPRKALRVALSGLILVLLVVLTLLTAPVLTLLLGCLFLLPASVRGKEEAKAKELLAEGRAAVKDLMAEIGKDPIGAVVSAARDMKAPEDLAATVSPAAPAVPDAPAALVLPAATETPIAPAATDSLVVGAPAAPAAPADDKAAGA